MAREIIFFVEGKADEKFLRDYFGHLKVNFSFDFFKIQNNVASAEKITSQQLKKVKIENVYFIIDADEKNQVNNKKKYHETIKNILKKLEYQDIFISNFLQNNIFYFPDNQNYGTLENLINNILKINFQDCVEIFEKCLKKIESIKKERLPDLKSKIRTYDYLTGGSRQDTERDYLDSQKYDLNHSSLLPLKNFLQKI